MLNPERRKFRKERRHTLRGRIATRGTHFTFGKYAVVADEPGFITSRQIEAARITITKRVKKMGKLWIRVFPDRPYTKKPLEVRMGGGKGSLDHWRTPVLPGLIIFEFTGITPMEAKHLVKLAGAKLNFRTRFLSREDLE